MSILEDVERIVTMNHVQKSFLVQVAHNHPEITFILSALVAECDSRGEAMTVLLDAVSPPACAPVAEAGVELPADAQAAVPGEVTPETHDTAAPVTP
jgi:hypothetical protein